MDINLTPVIDIIIRDDDVSYFTKPQCLENIYRPLLELGLPINLAVIPIMYTQSYVALRIQDYFALNEPVKPVKYDKKYLMLVGENEDLVDFVKQHNFEVLQHGLMHEKFQKHSTFIPEFCINNAVELQRRAELGIKILSKTFGKRPRFFVPPWDVLSKQGYDVTSKLFDGVLLASMALSGRRNIGKLLDFFPRHLPFNFIPSFFVYRMKGKNYCIFRGKFLVLEHRGLSIWTNFNEEALFDMFKYFSLKWRNIVIVNHHWLLASNPKLLDMWYKLVNYILSDDRFNIVSISDLYKKLVN